MIRQPSALQFVHALLPAIWLLFSGALPAPGDDIPPAKSPGHWIVVTAPAFADALQPLIAHRKAEGFDVTVVNVNQVLNAQDIRHGPGGKLLDAVRNQWQTDSAHSYVLLVGTAITPGLDAANTDVPGLIGTVGRMKGLPTDNQYGCAAGEFLPKVPVGRWPVQTVDEATSLVAKTLAFEEDGLKKPAWRRSINLLVGSPGGATPAEKSLGDWYVGNTVAATSRLIDPLWQVRSIYHIPTSPWYVSDNALHEQSLAFLQQAQAFTLHMGHSSPQGFWSDNARFLDAGDWTNLNVPHGAGVLMTCGCFACQLDPHGQEEHDGYGLAAIRSKAGPVAVIGASAESYSVAGYCAFNGLLPVFSNSKFPDRLGECWLDVKAGIARGEVGLFTFKMFDYGDGSNGTIDLETQRKEHLEMWTLLGDPAMRLPDVRPEITLHVPATVKAGDVINVSGELPRDIHIDRVHLTLERPMGIAPGDLIPLPKKNGPQRDSVIMSNFKKSSDRVVCGQDAPVHGEQFAAEIRVPEAKDARNYVVRVTAEMEGAERSGVAQLKAIGK